MHWLGNMQAINHYQWQNYTKICDVTKPNCDGLVQDGSNSSALTTEMLQSSISPNLLIATKWIRFQYHKSTENIHQNFLLIPPFLQFAQFSKNLTIELIWWSLHHINIHLSNFRENVLLLSYYLPLLWKNDSIDFFLRSLLCMLASRSETFYRPCCYIPTNWILLIFNHFAADFLRWQSNHRQPLIWLCEENKKHCHGRWIPITRDKISAVKW